MDNIPQQIGIVAQVLTPRCVAAEPPEMVPRDTGRVPAKQGSMKSVWRRRILYRRRSFLNTGEALPGWPLQFYIEASVGPFQ